MDEKRMIKQFSFYYTKTSWLIIIKILGATGKVAFLGDVAYPSIRMFYSRIHPIKVACTYAPIFEKNMKRYPIFSNYQIDQMHK